LAIVGSIHALNREQKCLHKCREDWLGSG